MKLIKGKSIIKPIIKYRQWGFNAAENSGIQYRTHFRVNITEGSEESDV